MDRGMLQSKGWPKVQKDCTTNIYLLYILKRTDSRFLKGQEGPLPECKAVPWPWKTGPTEVSFERDAKGKEQSRDMGTLLSSDVMTYIKKECDVNSALRYRI